MKAGVISFSIWGIKTLEGKSLVCVIYSLKPCVTVYSIFLKKSTIIESEELKEYLQQ